MKPLVLHLRLPPARREELCPDFAKSMEQRYVAVLDIAGGDRLFCSDRYRDEWTGRFGFAESFRARHEAEEVAQRHGGRVALWADAHAFEPPA